MDMADVLAYADHLPRLSRDICIECEHHFSAVSREALGAAIADHVAYVNTQLPRADDPHFALARMSILAQ